MSRLIPIQYHKRKYPNGIVPKIKEAAGHFDIESVDTSTPISLHTEYCFMGRKLASPIINSLPTIKGSQKNTIPQLWFNEKWAKEFKKFIVKLIGENHNLKVIEIHPPFSDYCDSFDKFLNVYEVFENEILDVFPEVDILIENRTGSRYRGGKFLLSRYTDLLELSKKIESYSLKLRITLDVPQLFTCHLGPKPKSKKNISNILSPLAECNDFLRGMHIWGKRRNDSGRWIPHIGNLNTYFDNNISTKDHFLKELFNVFKDQKKRYFVPEVNSGDEDLKSIIEDIRKVGFKFV